MDTAVKKASGEWRVATAGVTIFVVIGAEGMLPVLKIASGDAADAVFIPGCASERRDD